MWTDPASQARATARHDASRLAAHHAEPWTAGINQVAVQSGESGEQPGLASDTGRAEQGRIQHEQRKHRLTFIDGGP